VRPLGQESAREGLSMTEYRGHSLEQEDSGAGIDTTPLKSSLSDLGRIRLQRASGSPLEGLWNTLVRE